MSRQKKTTPKISEVPEVPMVTPEVLEETKEIPTEQSEETTEVVSETPKYNKKAYQKFLKNNPDHLVVSGEHLNFK